MSKDYPLGAILAYGADLDVLPLETPWLSCEGQFLRPDDYEALFDLLSTNNGGDEAGEFALPDYRGQFLRGMDSGRGIDKDAGKPQDGRLAPCPTQRHPGNAGDAVGSVQGSAIAAHDHQFVYRSSSLKIQNGNSHSPHTAQTHQADDSSGTADDGGGESRPKNIAVNFLILSKLGEPAKSSTPVGAIIAYAGELTDVHVVQQLAKQGWLPCDGRRYSKYTYSNLYNAIGANHGQQGDEIAVPDLRGVFLRGVVSGSGRDPGPRGTPRDDLHDQGNKTGVGSYEDDANITHDHNYQTWAGGQKMLDFWDWTVMGTSSQDRASSTAEGSENRPINISTNFLICYANGDSEDDASRENGVSFTVPVGAVVPYAAGPDAAEPDKAHPIAPWLVCNGYPQDREGSPLYRVISVAYGATSDSSFNVPDYRALFLRGVDGGRKRDPDAALRDFSRADCYEKGNNGAKVGSLQYSSFKAHSHTYQFNDEEHRTNYGNGAECVGATTDTRSTESTGTYETRPRNTYVVYLIKSA